MHHCSSMIFRLIAISVASLALYSCGPRPERAVALNPKDTGPSTKPTPGATKPTAKPAPAWLAKRVSDRPANEKGHVMILEYHKIEERETRWGRSIPKFKADLERLYKLGYRPVTLSEFMEDRMQLQPGATPVVFTFDDSAVSQFKILPDGSIDPNCAIGIWMKFAESHPDFPIKATWFLLPPYPFMQKSSWQKKIKMLKDWGSEFGSHTLSHKLLSKMTDEQVIREIGGSFEWLDSIGCNSRLLCLPYGGYPKNRALAKGVQYKGKTYNVHAVMMAGSSPTPVPGEKGYNAHRLPRIQGIDGDYGINYWINLIKKDSPAPYVAP